MTSQIILRLTRFSSVPRLNKFNTQQCLLIPSQTSVLATHNQIRLAGHAKWQNIASTKSKNDLAKGKLISRYVLMVRRAIVAGGMQGDPKLNSRLGKVLMEASKMNVPKNTLERAITRSLNVKIIPVNLEISGPGGCAIIARCETDSVPNLRREVKKAIRKLDSTLVPDETLINMFQSRGFVRTEAKTIDGREVNQDFAEEAAIVANAEEVTMECHEDAQDENLAQVWVFSTDASNLNACKGELEKLGLKILSHDLDLVPYRDIDFGEAIYKKVLEIVDTLSELEQVVDVFHNVKKFE